jgi:hypothetical protein
MDDSQTVQDRFTDQFAAAQADMAAVRAEMQKSFAAAKEKMRTTSSAG